MKGAKVLQSNGEYFIGIPLKDKWCKDNNTIVCSFILNETNQFGHTFVVAESTNDKNEQMPIIGHIKPYTPKNAGEASATESIPQNLVSQSGNNGGQAPAPFAPQTPQNAPVQNQAVAHQDPAPTPQAPQSYAPQVPINPTTRTPVNLNDPNQKATEGAFGEWLDVNGKEIPLQFLNLYHQ